MAKPVTAEYDAEERTLRLAEPLPERPWLAFEGKLRKKRAKSSRARSTSFSHPGMNERIVARAKHRFEERRAGKGTDKRLGSQSRTPRFRYGMNNSAIEPIGQDHPAHRYLVAHLALRMSGISEDMWCAGWLIDLEFRLWEAIQGGTSDRFAEKDLNELAELSTLVGGWHNGERFIPIDEWHSIVSEHGRTSTDRQD